MMKHTAKAVFASALVSQMLGVSPTSEENQRALQLTPSIDEHHRVLQREKDLADTSILTEEETESLSKLIKSGILKIVDSKHTENYEALDVEGSDENGNRELQQGRPRRGPRPDGRGPRPTRKNGPPKEGPPKKARKKKAPGPKRPVKKAPAKKAPAKKKTGPPMKAPARNNARGGGMRGNNGGPKTTRWTTDDTVYYDDYFYYYDDNHYYDDMYYYDDLYYYDDMYHYDDCYLYGGAYCYDYGKGGKKDGKKGKKDSKKDGKKGKKGKGKGKSGKGYYYYDDIYYYDDHYYYDDLYHYDDMYNYDDVYGNDDGMNGSGGLVSMVTTGFQDSRAVADFIPLSPLVPSESFPGVVYLYNQEPVFGLIDGSFPTVDEGFLVATVDGKCTRIDAAVGPPDYTGSSYCQFTYSFLNELGLTEASITAEGPVRIGSEAVLAMTGGTGIFRRSVGQVVLRPVSVTASASHPVLIEDFSLDLPASYIMEAYTFMDSSLVPPGIVY